MPGEAADGRQSGAAVVFNHVITMSTYQQRHSDHMHAEGLFAEVTTACRWQCAFV